MLSKVIKKLNLAEKKSGGTPGSYGAAPQKPKFQGKSGFHVKANSQQGASRQRSIGNRNNKSGK